MTPEDVGVNANLLTTIVQLNTIHSMTKTLWSVYLLIDPRDGEIRYVGGSKHPIGRLFHHLTDDLVTKEKHRWLCEIVVSGHRPIQEILASYRSQREMIRNEKAWIRRLSLAGCKLFNQHWVPKPITKAVDNHKSSKIPLPSMRNPLERAVKKAGGVRKVSEALKLSTQAIYLYLRKDRRPSEEFLAYLGLERVVIYRPIRKKK